MFLTDSSMHVIGLTGGIAMGKSFAAAVFRRAGVPVFDADATVHRLQGPGGAAVAAIGRAFPGSVYNGAVNRAALRKLALGSPTELTKLEAILHPMVRAASRRFVARHRRAGAAMVVLEVPLLLETGQDAEVDCVAVVTAPWRVQLHRLRSRGRMSETELAAVISRQMSDRQRRRSADAVIHSGLSKHHAVRQVHRLIAKFR